MFTAPFIVAVPVSVVVPLTEKLPFVESVKAAPGLIDTLPERDSTPAPSSERLASRIPAPVASHRVRRFGVPVPVTMLLISRTWSAPPVPLMMNLFTVVAVGRFAIVTVAALTVTLSAAASPSVVLPSTRREDDKVVAPLTARVLLMFVAPPIVVAPPSVTVPADWLRFPVSVELPATVNAPETSRPLLASTLPLNVT